MIFSFFEKKKPSEKATSKSERRMPRRDSVRPSSVLPSEPSTRPSIPAEKAKSDASTGRSRTNDMQKKGLPDLNFTPTPLPDRPAPAPVAEPARAKKTEKLRAVPAARQATVSPYDGLPRSLIVSRPLGLEDNISSELTISQFEKNFTVSRVMDINLNDEFDQEQADVEQVAILFANGQAEVARSLLDSFVVSYQPPAGLRFWQMYFALLQVMGQEKDFEQLAARFAAAYEISPPHWLPDRVAIKGDKPVTREFKLQGVLTVESSRMLTPMIAAMKSKDPILVNCVSLISCDDVFASQLAMFLQRARVLQVPVRLEGTEKLLNHLQPRLMPGLRQSQGAWRLALELLLFMGNQARFEDQAVDYAMTFETSPPSWENLPLAVQGKLLLDEFSVPQLDAVYLTGVLTNHRFEQLLEELATLKTPIIDCSQLIRMDFFSAGQLSNQLNACRTQGLDVIIRSPHHLVAELLGVIGIQRLAKIIVPRF